MDPETKQLLRENLDIAKENNVMLKRIARSQKWAHISRFLYWGIIIFSSIGAYYFVKPFLGNLLNVYGVSGGNNFSDFSKTFDNNKQQMQDFINAMK
jgi:hypothetical protein